MSKARRLVEEAVSKFQTAAHRVEALPGERARLRVTGGRRGNVRIAFAIQQWMDRQGANAAYVGTFGGVSYVEVVG